MTLTILIIALWLTDGSVIYSEHPYGDADACEMGKANALPPLLARQDVIGGDAVCVTLESARSQHS